MPELDRDVFLAGRIAWFIIGGKNDPAVSQYPARLMIGNGVKIGVIVVAIRFLKNLLVIASLGLSLPGLALADEPKSVAKLTDAGGTVMVDRGKGFVTTKIDAPLFENDRVITLDGSMAEITYTDGCRTKLKSNNLIVISIDPGCKAAILDATKAAPGVAAVDSARPFVLTVAGLGVVAMVGISRE